MAALALCFIADTEAVAEDRNAGLELAAKHVSEAVATGEVIAAAKGTLKQQGDKVPPQRAACLSAMEPRSVANRIGYPLAEDFSRDEFLALTRFLDTPEGKRIQQARAERLASGNLVFRLTPEESAVVGKALPAPLAAKWSAGAATQPNTLQAMRKVFEEQQAICRNEETSPRPTAPAPVNYREGLPPNVGCSQPRLSLVSELPDKPVSVTVRVWIGEDGSVARTAVEKPSGLQPVDNAARRAMNGMRCSARGSGALVPFTTTQSFVVRAGG
ncbi:energy transducer TonB [Cupriavidus gilardii]|uniref:energy transducer TonB n=1 Tax=Cupriavidus gilardii TaxID=82541 RepID=UPI001573292E|nr:energy transducer TonB [Cupriavidus gilardii]NSX04771.1 TonB family protein [Cupriavidus gilardii]